LHRAAGPRHSTMPAEALIGNDSGEQQKKTLEGDLGQHIWAPAQEKLATSSRLPGSPSYGREQSAWGEASHPRSPAPMARL